jgi:hypothetical protein
MMGTESTIGMDECFRSIQVLPAGLANIQGAQETALRELTHTVGKRAVPILDD